MSGKQAKKKKVKSVDRLQVIKRKKEKKSFKLAKGGNNHHMFVNKGIKVGDVVITRVKEKKNMGMRCPLLQRSISIKCRQEAWGGGGTRREIDIHRSRRQRLKNRLNVVSQKTFRQKECLHHCSLVK